MSTDKPHEETNNGQRNVIEFEEDTKGRRFHATVSDNAIEAISHPVSLFLTRGTNLQPRRSKANASDAVEEELLVSGTDFMLEPEILDRQAENVGRDVPKKLSPATDEQLDTQRLKELFRERGGRLRLEEPQLKAKGKLDYTRRLTYLFLYAEERAGNESVLRSTLTTILDDSSVSDGNARSWIAKESALVKDGDNVHLNSAGRRAARAYLKEVFTDEIQPGWLPGEAGSSRSSKMKTTTSKPGKGEQPTKGSKGKGGRTSKVTSNWVPKWTALGLLPNAYFVFKEKSITEKGLLGLWAIRKALGDEGKIVASKSLRNFLYHAFEFKLHIRSLESAFKGKTAEGRVLHIAGTRFQITPEGMGHVDKIVQESKATTAGGAAKAKAAG